MNATNLVLKCSGVGHWWGEASNDFSNGVARGVLHDVDLSVSRGSIVALVGPSGCGKTTLLRAILGTHPPRAGEIVVFSGSNAQRVQSPGRDRGVVYQQYSLFPFLTALENVALGLKLEQTGILFRALCFSRWGKLRRRQLDEAAEMLTQFGLGHALNLYPHQMSGGMCQRVALAQALIMKPQILLLDEPFGALDEQTRRDLQRMLLRLYQKNLRARERGEPAPYTIFLVTHDLEEALYVGDRVVGLSQHWAWRESGFAACPGATIVYDQPAPIFAPDDEIDEDDFADQHEEIRRAVFQSTTRQRNPLRAA
jgi:NitT/TauT family transport system ATP-binding protein